MKLKKRELRLQMAAAGYFTYTALADELGVSRAAVSQWAKGDNISLENIAKLCRLFGCTIDELTDDFPSVLSPNSAAMIPA